MKSLFVIFFLFVAAINAYKFPVSQASFNGNLVAVAGDLGLNDLLKIAAKVGLLETLASKGPFTVFGPTDEAFEEIPPLVYELILKDNKTAYKELILYHVLNGEVRSTAIEDNLLVPTLFSGKKIRFNVYDGNTNGKVITAQCAPIDLTKVDQEASNGLIHVLNRVMIPPVGTVVDFVEQFPQYFSILGKAVVEAGLGSTLSSAGPFTVFAPTNDAFYALPEKELEEILNNSTFLDMVLKYHVVEGTYCSAGLVSGTVTTVEGADINIVVSSGGVTVNGANVDFSDAPVSNGVVHVIDEVLMPPTRA